MSILPSPEAPAKAGSEQAEKSPSLGARLLLRIITDYSRADKRRGGDGWTWASESHWAEQLGRSTRTVRTYLRELEAGEAIEKRRRGCGRTNQYRPKPPAPAQTGSPFPVRPEADCRSDRKPVSGHIESESEALTRSSGAAAALEKPREETPERLPPAVARDRDLQDRWAKVSPDARKAFLFWYHEKRTPPSRALCADALRDHNRYLRDTDGNWQTGSAPPDPAAAERAHQEHLIRQRNNAERNRQLVEQSRREAEERRRQREAPRS